MKAVYQEPALQQPAALPSGGNFNSEISLSIHMCGPAVN